MSQLSLRAPYNRQLSSNLLSTTVVKQPASNWFAYNTCTLTFYQKKRWWIVVNSVLLVTALRKRRHRRNSVI